MDDSTADETPVISAKRECLMSLRHEWDEKKATSNLKKHKASFDEAMTVFDDPLAAIFDDDDHSLGEKREIIIGYSVLQRLIIVCFTQRAEDVVRIVSARVATREERQRHEENAIQ
jgi:uncharacterized DUF497 family protein